MIYLFNDVKELTGTVRNNHILNLLYEREKNGIYSVSAEIPVTYNDQGTNYNYNKKIQKSDFLGHYDKEGRFQLHKIAAVDIENGSIFVKGIHIFFDEAKAGAIIQDRRFINREIIDGARVAFGSIGWSVADFDVSVGKTYNFYNVTPLEARQILVETFGFEFDYWLDFDGKKVTNRHVAVKEKIGEKTNKRYTYGHNVLNIRAEQDYSEIYTAVIGRGKGEEIEETGGYGRRIEYTDVVWSTPSKPLNKPAGTRILEDTNATQLFGYKENGVVKPRIKVEVFSDIESPTELIQASYEWLMDNNVPKAVFSLKVADGDGLNLGDEVYVIYRDIELIKSARVEKVTDDLVSGNRDVEFGDTAYFDTDRRLSGLRSDLKRYSGETGDRIYRLKMEFNRRFDEEVSSWVEEFEQNLIDQQAQIEADRVNMTNLIEGTRTEFTDNLNAEITQTKEYADQQAQEKAEAVRTDLGAVTSGHQQMLDDLESNVINIDEFLGDSREITLDERLFSINESFEERIRRVDSNTFNMIRGTQLNEPDVFTLMTGATLDSSERINFVNVVTSQSIWTAPRVRFEQEVRIEAGKKYIFAVEYRTDSVPELDWLRIQRDDGLTNLIPYSDGELLSIKTDGEWNRVITEFTFNETITGKFEIGTHYASGDGSREPLHIRLPYLTGSENTEWVYHPLDATQNISEVARRITNLEDGYSEMTTRSEFDFKTGHLDQHIKSVEDTVEGNKTVLQRVEDWQATNGSSVEETIYGFNRKVWLNDVSNIGANLIPQSANTWENGGYFSSGNNDNSNTSRLRIKRDNPIRVQQGLQYTFKCSSAYNSSVNQWLVTQYVDGTPVPMSEHYVLRGNELTFTAKGNEVLLTAMELVGTSILSRFIDNPDRRIHIKIEQGATATPKINALSRIEQLADKINMSVIELDGTFLKQSDFQLTPNYWQLGSMRIGADNVSSVLRGSPDSLDAVVSNFNLTGNLNARGQITTLAVDAIEGNFARLFANQLTANVITSDHIQVGTALVGKMFATSARIDQLITKTHFVNEMNALTLNVVDLNASHIRSRLLTANTIEATWIKSGTALLDRVFSSTAMFERMMAKSGFVTTLNTVTIDTDQLTIRRPDGVAWVTNGVHRFNLSIQRNQFMNPSVSWTGQNYTIPDQFWRTIENMYTYHDSRYLATAFLVALTDTSSSASAYMHVRVREFSSGNLVGEAKVLAKKAETTSQNITLDMGKPTFTAKQFYLEVKMDEGNLSGSVQNYGLARVNRAVMRG